jgi:hypothetical protein
MDSMKALFEGFSLGLLDGLDEGILLGLFDGFEDGLLDGLLEGEAVGASVLPITCSFSKKIVQIIIIHLFLLEEDVRMGGSNIM